MERFAMGWFNAFVRFFGLRKEKELCTVVKKIEIFLEELSFLENELGQLVQEYRELNRRGKELLSKIRVKSREKKKLLEELKERLRILEEITVPELVNAHAVIMGRLELEAAIEAKRKSLLVTENNSSSNIGE